MKRIHTLGEFKAAAMNFRDQLAKYKSPLAAVEHLPQDDTTLGLLIIAREETESMGNLPQDAANMRSTIHALTNHNPLIYDADTWLVAELVRLRSDRAHSILVKLAKAEKLAEPFTS